MNPPASKWFVAPGPDLKRSHFKPTSGRLRHLYAGATVTGSFDERCTYTSRWSCRCMPTRSEEHTSELQSQSNLVCRLLLEKKKVITMDLLAVHRRNEHMQLSERVRTSY